MIPDAVKNEPALIVAFVQATIGLAISFGVQLSPGQQAAIIAWVIASSALVAYLRVHITPVRKLLPQPQQDPTP